MRIRVQLVDRPIRGEDWLLTPSGEEGALVTFSGCIRASEHGAGISGLEYEAYTPMAEKELHRIALAVLDAHGGVRLSVAHRLGVVPVGEVAVSLAVTAVHRQCALRVVEDFLDYLKRDVPIWKVRALPRDETNAPYLDQRA